MELERCHYCHSLDHISGDCPEIAGFAPPSSMETLEQRVAELEKITFDLLRAKRKKRDYQRSYMRKYRDGLRKTVS
jgi:pyruvate-formate lyase-activating enzyme